MDVNAEVVEAAETIDDAYGTEGQIRAVVELFQYHDTVDMHAELAALFRSLDVTYDGGGASFECVICTESLPVMHRAWSGVWNEEERPGEVRSVCEGCEDRMHRD